VTSDAVTFQAGPAVFALSEHAQTVAVAESLTGGMLCSALVEVPGASAVVRGGVVAYATELKHRVLGVDAALLAANGAVDPEVARQMAHGVRELLGADWGLATTGVAGPDPQDGIAPGIVYVAVAGPLPQACETLPQAEGITAKAIKLDLRGGRAEVRAAATARALDLLLTSVIAAAATRGGAGT
jgi:nicotinamide-nucleotide amidase